MFPCKSSQCSDDVIGFTRREGGIRLETGKRRETGVQIFAKRLPGKEPRKEEGVSAAGSRSPSKELVLHRLPVANCDPEDGVDDGLSEVVVFHGPEPIDSRQGWAWRFHRVDLHPHSPQGGIARMDPWLRDFTPDFIWQALQALPHTLTNTGMVAQKAV